MRKNLFGNRRGAQAVEFALCLPILMMIISATLDYGWYFHQRMILTTATAQAAKAGAQETTTAAIATVGKAVGEDVWTAAGLSTAHPTFVFTTPEAGGVNTSGGPNLTVQVVATANVSCVVCFQMGGLETMPTTMQHTSVEYWVGQPDGNTPI